MKRILILATLTTLVLPTLQACESTIRGLGRDTAKTVNATQNAARRTGRAIRN